MNRLFIVLFLIPKLIFSQGSGNALSFNGANEAINLGNTVANNCRTIEMWFKPDNTITSSNSAPISLMVRDFSNGDRASINEFGVCFYPSSWGNGGRLAFFRRIGSALHTIYSDADQWIANQWYHVAVTIDPTDGMSMYVNGVKQQSTNSSTAPIGVQTGSSTDNISLGKWGNIDIRYFGGELDEVRLWDFSKTQIEIQQKMCSKLSGNEPGLRAYYNFNSQNLTLLLDSSTNNFDGSLLNMTNANRIYSGAPIGDTSTYLYNSSGLVGQSLTLSASPQTYLTVNSINSTSEGIHLYKVSSLPNSLQNLSDPVTSDYYGVFLTHTSGTFDVDYNFSNTSSSCPEILSRNDNSVMSWTNLRGRNVNGSFQLTNQSTVGYTNRAEFIIDKVSFSVDLGNDTTLCQGQSLVLDATTLDATYVWQDNSTNPTFTVRQQGIYWTKVTKDDCSVTDTIVVAKADCGVTDTVAITKDDHEIILEIPNIFSPNKDNFNDLFVPIASTGITSMQTLIYNRWGEKIYETNNPLIEWSGNNVTSGAYYWIVHCVDRNGDKWTKKGWINLLR